MLPLNGVPATPFGHEHALKGKILRQVALLRRVQPPGEKCGLKLSGGQRDRMRAGTPALPGDAVPAVRSGVSDGRLLRSRRAPFGKLPFAREPAPPGRADHSRKNGLVDEDEPRMNTKTDGPPSTTSGTKMPIQFCPWCDFVSLVDNPLNWFQIRDWPDAESFGSSCSSKQSSRLQPAAGDFLQEGVDLLPVGLPPTPTTSLWPAPGTSSQSLGSGAASKSAQPKRSGTVLSRSP